MFETAVVESKPHPIRKGRVATLPVSVAMHVLAISGVIVSNVWSVKLPTSAPPQYEAFAGVRTVPLPPQEQPVRPKPPEPSAERQDPRPVFSDPVQTNPITVTPGAIPDLIPDVAAGVGGPPEVAVADPSAVRPGGGGDVGIGDDGPVVVGPGRATMPVVIKRVQPEYPKLLVTIGVRGSAVVECIVGRDGVITSATVVSATHELFGEAAREAVMQWKFLPGKVRGQPVATIFQLRVDFQVKR